MHYVRALRRVAMAMLRIVLGSAIGFGIIGELDPFPYRAISYWQARIANANLDYPGSDVFLWCADHWIELSVAIALIQLSRLTWALGRSAE